MTDRECVELLRWAAPRLGLRWKGFRNVRGQVCKRIGRRIAQLGLADVPAYRSRLDTDPAEWLALDRLCVVTISRFRRDRAVWDALRDEVLPSAAESAMAAHEEELRCWSIGCASGEEPYSISILWTLELARRYPRLGLRVLATDVDDEVLARAHAARYPASALRDVPPRWRIEAFDPGGADFVLRDRFRTPVELRREDVRKDLPDGTFRVILCRNVVFTYLHEALQHAILERILTRLAGGGTLVLGRHERLPEGAGLGAWLPALGIFRHEGDRDGCVARDGRILHGP